MAFSKLGNLEKLREANRLLNKKNQQLGLKQMKIAQDFQAVTAELKAESEPKPETKNLEELKIPSEESLEKTTATLKTNEKKPFSFFALIGLISSIAILLVFAIYWLNPQMLSKKLNIISKNIELKLNKKNEFGVINGLGLANKPVLIAAGTYSSLDEAIEAKRKLAKLTGDALKIIKSKKARTYSIQIGPRYTDYEDTMIVFEELVKYRIEDLSVRFVEVFSY